MIDGWILYTVSRLIGINVRYELRLALPPLTDKCVPQATSSKSIRRVERIISPWRMHYRVLISLRHQYEPSKTVPSVKLNWKLEAWSWNWKRPLICTLIHRQTLGIPLYTPLIAQILRCRTRPHVSIQLRELHIHKVLLSIVTKINKHPSGMKFIFPKTLGCRISTQQAYLNGLKTTVLQIRPPEKNTEHMWYIWRVSHTLKPLLWSAL